MRSTVTVTLFLALFLPLARPAQKKTSKDWQHMTDDDWDRIDDELFDEEEKAERLNAFRQALEQFMRRAMSDGLVIGPTSYKKRRAFMCGRYNVCEAKSSN